MNSEKEFIPGYIVQKKLGVGGMATVFLARDTASGEDTALKLLHPRLAQAPLALSRFVREAKLLCAFRHNNIVKGIKSGQVKGLYFVIMEFVDGESIAEILARMGRFPQDLALEVIMQMADALDYMRLKGIVHRDIKPDNILLTPDGIVKLCDLGLAKPIGSKDSNDSTANNIDAVTAGTAQYMSPEQALGGDEVDVRSDIYSLGVTLYQMITGELPFDGADSSDVLASQVQSELQGAVLKRGKLSQYVHYYIEKMMAKNKEERYQTPGEIVKDISNQLTIIKQTNFDPDDYRSQILGGLKKNISSAQNAGVKKAQGNARKSSSWFRKKKK